MKFSLRQLRYALAAAKHSNLTLAAEELHVSQPSISTAITELEQLFGQPLFVRQRGLGVSLTPFGRTVMAQAKRVLAEARTFSDMGSDNNDFSGELVLGCYEDLAPYCLPQILVGVAVCSAIEGSGAPVRGFYQGCITRLQAASYRSYARCPPGLRHGTDHESQRRWPRV